MLDQNNLPLMGERSFFLAHLVGIRVHEETLPQALLEAPWGTERENWTVVERVKASVLFRILGLQIKESSWSLLK